MDNFYKAFVYSWSDQSQDIGGEPVLHPKHVWIPAEIVRPRQWPESACLVGDEIQQALIGEPERIGPMPSIQAGGLVEQSVAAPVVQVEADEAVVKSMDSINTLAP